MSQPKPECLDSSLVKCLCGKDVSTELLLCGCSIGSDEDDAGDGDEEASVGDPSETAVSRDAANDLTSSSSSSSSLSPTALDHCPDLTAGCLVDVTNSRLFCRHRWQLGVVASVVRRMNKVTVHWARLVLGWVTVFRRVYHHDICNQPTRSTQPCIPAGSLNRVSASAGIKAGMSTLPGGR